MFYITSVALLSVLLISPADAGRLGEPNDETRHLSATVVNLGTAGDFAILTKAGVTTTGVTSVTGDVGASPIAATGITGFGLVADSTNEFSTSSLVVGKIYAADYAPPTPAKMTTAIGDMEIAYTDAAGRSANYIEYSKGDLTHETLTPGVYKWGGNVNFTDSVTFSGTATDIWILQIAKNLQVANGAQVVLADGALAKNIFWQVSEAVGFGTTSQAKGVFLVKTGIVFENGSSLNGVALAQTAVTLDAATIVK